MQVGHKAKTKQQRRWCRNPSIIKNAQNITEDNSSDEHEHLETKWIKLECRPNNIAIGVFYGPQESGKNR